MLFRSSVVTVISNTTVPVVGLITPQPSLGCNSTVTLAVITDTAVTYNYDWTGVSSFTSSIANPTINIAGDYSVTVTDPSNGCLTNVVLTIGTNTAAPSFTAMAMAATCSGTMANNDGILMLSGFSINDVYDYTQALTYTGSATYSSGFAIPLGGVLTNTLVNPIANTPYTIRLFSSNGCMHDTTVMLNPTLCNLPNTSLGIAKFGKVSDPLDDKTLDVTYIFTIINYGNDIITNVQIKDTLLVAHPAQYTIKSLATSSSSLVTNNFYNGLGNTNLLNAASSTLAVGAVETLTLVINLKPDTLTSLTNSAILMGVGSLGNNVRDTSNTGYDPDPNSNSNASDQGENIPTVIKLPDVDLFIPEVFTPNGDGINDVFKIKGIREREAKLTVYNRWGSLVYDNSAYDNTWDGTPNVSNMIIGNSKLPQGTYYYIVEFADGQTDAINGFVVLQY